MDPSDALVFHLHVVFFPRLIAMLIMVAQQSTDALIRQNPIVNPRDKHKRNRFLK
jgi:hypothetical protein